MKLESLTPQAIYSAMGNNPKAKTLALLVQTAFVEELDWNLKLDHREGFIYGELIQENGKPHGHIIVFVSEKTLYLIDDVVMFQQATIPEIMNAWPDGFRHDVQPTSMWAAKFVHEFHIA